MRNLCQWCGQQTGETPALHRCPPAPEWAASYLDGLEEIGNLNQEAWRLADAAAEDVDQVVAHALSLEPEAVTEINRLREDLEYVAEALENGHSGIEIAKQVRARLRAALAGEEKE